MPDVRATPEVTSGWFRNSHMQMLSTPTASRNWHSSRVIVTDGCSCHSSYVSGAGSTVGDGVCGAGGVSRSGDVIVELHEAAVYLGPWHLLDLGFQELPVGIL